MAEIITLCCTNRFITSTVKHTSLFREEQFKVQCMVAANVAFLPLLDKFHF